MAWDIIVVGVGVQRVTDGFGRMRSSERAGDFAVSGNFTCGYFFYKLIYFIKKRRKIFLLYKKLG